MEKLSENLLVNIEQTQKVITLLLNKSSESEWKDMAEIRRGKRWEKERKKERRGRKKTKANELFIDSLTNSGRFLVRVIREDPEVQAQFGVCSSCQSGLIHAQIVSIFLSFSLFLPLLARTLTHSKCLKFNWNDPTSGFGISILSQTRPSCDFFFS